MPDAIGKSVWYTALHRWDELVIAVLFASFGVVALFMPTRAQGIIPSVFGVLFNVEFILTGVFIILGILTHNYPLRVLAYVLYFIALCTIGALIAVSNQSPVALLCFAFASEIIFNLRSLTRDWKAKKNIAEIIQVSNRSNEASQGDS